jgi:hypothetical protein
VHDRLPTQPEHRRHDQVLVGRFATGDALPSEADNARALIASCPDCAALATDMSAIVSQMRQLPTPPRPRDFRISVEQAERLRGSVLQRLLRTLAGPGWATLRPAAGVAMSIGLVLAVVGAGMPAILPAAAPGMQPFKGSPGDMVTPAAGAPSDNRTAVEATSAVPVGAGATAPPPVVGTPLVPPVPSPVNAQGTPEYNQQTNPDSAPPTPPTPGGIAVEVTHGPSSVPTPSTPGTRPQPSQPISTAEPSASPQADANLQQPPAQPGPGDFGSKQLTTAAPVSDTTRSLFIDSGLGIALVGLAVLLLVIIARRRYSDPLLR